ncbi:hypothetical protein BSLG_000539 [Batrachochytrium salamandrivorans]|nr:hypothetical protein BSLG_000539 [Batrachochytrium salamandrivorans]
MTDYRAAPANYAETNGTNGRVQGQELDATHILANQHARVSTSGRERDGDAYNSTGDGLGKAGVMPRQSKSKKEVMNMPDDAEFQLAKAFISTVPNGKTFSLYDHLTSVVSHILQTRSSVALDNFESLSAELKRTRFRSELKGAPTSLRDVELASKEVELAIVRAPLFQRLVSEEAAEKDSADMGDIPDIMDLANFWEWAGVPSQRKISQIGAPMGKDFGTQRNYIIVEAEVKEGVVDPDDELANATLFTNIDAADKLPVNNTNNGDSPIAISKIQEDDEMELPKTKAKSVKPLTKETRSGVNRYVYYTSHFAGGPWTRLPDAVPEHLQCARKIHKYFTGNLTTKIVCHPAFLGTEAHYLRAQIARISSATVLSPNGYYIVDTDEAESEENTQAASIIINPDFEGFDNEQLLNLSNWVHHVQYILPQGRVTWENPNARAENTDESNNDQNDENNANDTDDADDEDESNAADPEIGQALLSAITEDEDHGDIPSWFSRVCSHLSSTKFAPIMLRSTRWPGAVVVAYNDKFANIYVGDGLKDLGSPLQRYLPPKLDQIQKEYGMGEGAESQVDLLVEQSDPTVEQEREFNEKRDAKNSFEDKDGNDEEDNDEEEEEEE